MKVLHLICNSHIDPVWQWDWNEGIAATLATFYQAAKFCDEYDYIFIDCPPLEIVADATICARLATMTLFVIRAEALQRTALPDVQKYYDEKRLPKMTVLLNGTTDAFSRYGNHRYGARYGYAYGSGSQYSSYGYGEDDDEKETSKKKK